jgi:hypothetical protein
MFEKMNVLHVLFEGAGLRGNFWRIFGPGGELSAAMNGGR